MFMEKAVMNNIEIILNRSVVRQVSQTPVYFIEGYCNKRRRFPRERPLLERLVCSYLHAVRSYLPQARPFVGFCLRCVRIYVSVLLILLPPWHGRGEATQLRVVSGDLFYVKLERTPSEGIKFSSTELKPSSISRMENSPGEN